MDLRKTGVQRIDSLAQWLKNSARLRERRPFSANLWNEIGITVIPVAKARWGFGGGEGSA